MQVVGLCQDILFTCHKTWENELLFTATEPQEVQVWNSISTVPRNMEEEMKLKMAKGPLIQSFLICRMYFVKALARRYEQSILTTELCSVRVC